MKGLLLLSLLFFSLAALADVSHDEVAVTLDKMVKEGTISAEEAEKAKLKMKAMSGDQWTALNQQAAKVAVSRGPASVEEVKGNDLDSAQFKQIQSDIKKMMPDYQE